MDPELGLSGSELTGAGLSLDMPVGPLWGMAESPPGLSELTVAGAGWGMRNPMQIKAGGGGWQLVGEQHSQEVCSQPVAGQVSLCANRFHMCAGTRASLPKAACITAFFTSSS